jgi:hypothetical protein
LKFIGNLEASTHKSDVIIKSKRDKYFFNRKTVRKLTFIMFIHIVMQNIDVKKTSTTSKIKSKKKTKLHIAMNKNVKKADY